METSESIMNAYQLFVLTYWVQYSGTVMFSNNVYPTREEAESAIPTALEALESSWVSERPPTIQVVTLDEYIMTVKEESYDSGRNAASEQYAEFDK